MSSGTGNGFKPPWWVAAIKEVGVSVVLLAVVCYAIWNGAAWMGETIVKPLFEKQMALFDQQSVMIDDTKEAIKIISDTVNASDKTNLLTVTEILRNRELILTGNQERIDFAKEQMAELKKITDNIK